MIPGKCLNRYGKRCSGSYRGPDLLIMLSQDAPDLLHAQSRRARDRVLALARCREPADRLRLLHAIERVEVQPREGVGVQRATDAASHERTAVDGALSRSRPLSEGPAETKVKTNIFSPMYAF